MSRLLPLLLAAALLPVLAHAAQTQLYVVFVWHMHQPPYVLPNGTAIAPWPRLWVVKGYYPMVALALAEDAHVTFDFTPTLLMQIEMVAEGRYLDPFLRVDLTPPGGLTYGQKAFVLQNYFSAPLVQIERYPRYLCLYERLQRLVEQYGEVSPPVVYSFSDQDYLDLQVLFNLAWYNLYVLQTNSTLGAIYQRALASNCTTHFTAQDLRALLDGQRYYARLLLSLIGGLGEEPGDIAIVTTPMYYPIMPLVADLSSALRSSYDYGMIVPPTGYKYPGDVYAQLLEAKRFYAEAFGFTPQGLWPPEMAVSDEALELAASAGFKFTFISGYTLNATLKSPGLLNYQLLYRQYGDRSLYIFVRDEAVSNYISFGASGDANSRGPAYAAQRAYDMILQARRLLESAGLKKGVVVVALDGENPLQYFNDDGVYFLRRLYGLIESTPGLHMATAFTAMNALKRSAVPLSVPIAPSTWAGGFWTWVGGWRQNLAWTILYVIRRNPANMTCMQIAEMGDWFFWYSGFYPTATPWVFDDLFRAYARCALGDRPYNYTWPLSVPIAFQSNVAVGWAGSPFERMVAPAGPMTLSVQVWAPGGGPSDVRAVLHFGPVDRFGGSWGFLYFAPMNFNGWSGNNMVYTTTVYLTPGEYELVYLAEGSNDYWAHAASTSDGNFWLTVVPQPAGYVQDAYVYSVNVYSGGRLVDSYQPAQAPSCVSAPSGSTVGVVAAVKSSGGAVYPTLYYGYGSWWWPINQVLAQPVGQSGGYTLYEANVTLPASPGYYEYVFEIYTVSGPYWVHVGGGNGAICIIS